MQTVNNYLLTLWVSVIILYYLLGIRVESRVGDPIQSFQAKNARVFIYKDHTTRANKVYYHYSLISDQAQQKSSPGFAGGMTITTDSGKVLSESLVIRLGTNSQVGKLMACAIFLDITYDAIGKPLPTKEIVKQSEFDSYMKAIDGALAGQPQIIEYKTYPMKIMVSKTNNNDLLLTIMPLNL